MGERAKVVIFSTTEGDDKPLKYPHMFRAAELIVVNKINLAPHLDFAIGSPIGNIEKVNPSVRILQLTACTGAGLEAWLDWLRGERAMARDTPFKSSDTRVQIPKSL